METEATPAPAPEPVPVINEEKLLALAASMRARQSLPLAVIVGALSAGVGAALWAAVTVATKYQIGWMAVGVGFLVGFAVRFAGKGMTPVFGGVGAVFALLGCVGGNLLSAVGFISLESEMGFFEILMRLTPGVATEVLSVTFSPMDLLFYGIAVYEGYKFSFVELSDTDLAELTR